jgi:hypothetical protein
VGAIFQFMFTAADGSSGTLAYISDLATNDVAVSTSFADTPIALNVGAGVALGERMQVRTNTSAQLRVRISFSSAGVVYVINTLGWSDSRGRNA